MTTPLRSSRRAPRALTVVAIAMAACLGVLSLTNASASTVRVAATKDVSSSVERCTSAPVSVTPTTSGATTTAVTITGPSDSWYDNCPGSALTVRLVTASGVYEKANQGPGVPIDVSGFPLMTTAITAAMVDVAGFALPTRWMPQAPSADPWCQAFNGDGTPLAGVVCAPTFAINNWHGSNGSVVGQLQLSLTGSYPPLPLAKDAYVLFNGTFPASAPAGAPQPNWDDALSTPTWSSVPSVSSGVSFEADWTGLPAISGRAAGFQNHLQVDFTISFQAP